MNVSSDGLKNLVTLGELKKLYLLDMNEKII